MNIWWFIWGIVGLILLIANIYFYNLDHKTINLIGIYAATFWTGLSLIAAKEFSPKSGIRR